MGVKIGLPAGMEIRPAELLDPRGRAELDEIGRRGLERARARCNSDLEFHELERRAAERVFDNLLLEEVFDLHSGTLDRLVELEMDELLDEETDALALRAREMDRRGR
jgi:hypothetical protein